MTNGRYQFFDELSAEQYAALKEDISRRGVFVPIERDADTGEILDGFNRQRICAELGIDPPIVERRFGSEEERVEHALTLNLKRRQLGEVAFGRGLRRLKDLRGLPQGAGRRKNGEENCDNMSQLAREVGISRRQAERRIKLAEDLEPHPDLAFQVDAGDMPVARALRVKREREKVERVHQCPEFVLPPNVDLREGDFREALASVEDGSVALVFTDPPYHRDWLGNWADLGTVAERILKPGGFLATYSGQAYLPDVLAALSISLQYVWTVAMVGSGPKTLIHDRRFYSEWKPLLVFGKPPLDRHRDWVKDLYRGEGPEKDAHPWQQGEAEARHFIEAFSQPGELVVDPFLGGGTTAAAAVATGRNFIGSEAEVTALLSAKERISGEPREAVFLPPGEEAVA